MSKKKIAVILASTVLIASLAIGGTLAYLTDSGSVTNTFTVGNVDIDLDEPNWVPANGLGVLPGDTILKDPTVTAIAGDSYMRVKVVIVADDLSAMTPERALLIKNTWDVEATTNFALASLPTPTDTTFYYNFGGVFSADVPADTATLFTEISIPTSYDSDDITLMGKYKIIITAQAIQSDNFVDAATAYAELPA